MKIKAEIINSFAKFMLGGEVFSIIKDLVYTVNNSELSNDEKRLKVSQEFSALGLSVATWMVNLGIELAVAYLKQYDGK